MPRLWTPQDLPADFKLGWYHFPDASTVTLDANGKIASIENKFDNGSRPCATADATKRHLIQKYNGYDTAYSDTTNYGGILMTNTSGLPVGNADLCMIFVQAPQDGVVGGYRGGNNFWIDNPYPDYRLRTDKGDFTGTGSTSNSSLHTLVVNRKSGTTSLRVDGGARGSQTPSSGYNTTLGTFGIKGADANYYVQKGSSLGAIIGARAGTADELYLIEKWYSTFTGVAVPSDNPYANGLPTVGGGSTLSAAAGAIILTGRTANLLFGHTLPAAPGALALTGQAVRPLAGRRLPAAGVPFVITGGAAAFTLKRSISIGTGTFMLGGQPVNLLHGFTMPATGAAFAFAGLPARLRTARRLIADGAAFLTAGQPIDLRRISQLAVPAGAGAFTLIGQAVGMRAARRIVAAPGALLLAGGSVTMIRTRATALGSGTFAITGSAVSIAAALRIFAGSGGLSLTGRAAILRLSRRLPSDRGAFAITGTAAAINIGTTAAPVFIPIANRYVVPARPRAFVIPARLRAFVIRKGASMSPIRKYQAEVRSYQADWSPDLAGQTIVGEIEAESNDPALIVDRVTYEGAIMRFRLRGGTPGEVSTLTFTAPTLDGDALVWAQTVSVPLIG